MIPTSHTFLPFHQISVQLNKKVLLSDIYNKIAANIHHPPLLDKLERDTKWGKTVTNLVDWQAIKKAQDQYLKPARVKYTKMMFNLNQTNSQNNKFYGTSSLCQCCDREVETFSHILTCTSKISTSLYH